MWSSSSSSYFKRCHIQIPLSTFPINAINQRSRSFHIITANKLLHPNISSSVNFNSKLPPKLFHQSTIKKSSIHVPSYCRPLSSNSPTTSTVKTQLPPPSDAQRKTIYALATPPGKAGVAVIRFSGPEAYAVYERVTRPYTSISSNSPNKIGEANISSSTKLEHQSDVNHARVQGERSSRKRKPLEHRKMTRCIVVNPLTGEDIDDGLAVFFKGPSSFTTEDVLELHVHSGRAILSSILSALSTLSIPLVPSNGSTRTEAPLLIRPAERGEFTRRAFEGGRLDLTQAEALGDLINAETDVQRRVALLGSRGKTREVFEHIREEIIQAMALTEALIDFGEGEDVEEGVFDEARGIVEGVRDRIRRYLSDGRRGEILRNGVRLAIFGPPNAGKSSLLNYLAGREAAIVTDVPGTTRDILEVRLDLDGLAVVLADTAGLRTTEDVVEKIGVEKAVERIAESDISLCVLSLAGGEGERVEEEVTRLIGPDTYVLLNKVDACGEEDVDALRKELPGCAGTWIISVSTGQGLDKFVSDIGGVLKARFGLEGEKDVVVTNERHRGELERAEVHLAAFAETEDVVVAAEELRYASRAIGRVTGAVDVEDVLDSLFSTFCIGK